MAKTTGYVKFLKDYKQHKAGSVSYQTRAAKLVKEGIAEEVDYEEYHKTIKNNVTGAKEPAKTEGQMIINTPDASGNVT